MMDDRQFLSNINKIAAEHRLRLPLIDESPPSGDVISAWAGFLELCVKRGIKLSDERWARLMIEKQKPVTVFELQGSGGQAPDADFRVGLQLLMGMLGDDARS